jgi:VWFA-related protein
MFASVTDKDGKPIMDMEPAEFEVREGGKLQQIVVRPSTTPLRVALIVADRGSGSFQGGALRFCEALLGQGEISIVGLIVQPEKLVDFSSSPDSLRGALQQLGRRGVTNQTGAQLLETILQATKDVKRNGSRPAIVVMRSGGEAPPSVRAEQVRAAIRESGAILYTASTAGNTSFGRGLATGDEAASMNRFYSQERGTDDGLSLATVLDDGSRETGGRQITVAGTSIVPTMQQIAAELGNQYEITYTVPTGTKPGDRVAVTSKRRGVTVHAPSWVAN